MRIFQKYQGYVDKGSFVDQFPLLLHLVSFSLDGICCFGASEQSGFSRDYNRRARNSILTRMSILARKTRNTRKTRKSISPCRPSALAVMLFQFLFQLLYTFL